MEQIALIAEPFHRMFSLDNIAIQFPHADVERVPTSMDPSASYVNAIWVLLMPPPIQVTILPMLAFCHCSF